MFGRASDTLRLEADVARRLIVTGGESMNELVVEGELRGGGWGVARIQGVT